MRWREETVIQKLWRLTVTPMDWVSCLYVVFIIIVCHCCRFQHSKLLLPRVSTAIRGNLDNFAFCWVFCVSVSVWKGQVKSSHIYMHVYTGILYIYIKSIQYVFLYNVPSLFCTVMAYKQWEYCIVMIITNICAFMYLLVFFRNLIICFLAIMCGTHFSDCFR